MKLTILYNDEDDCLLYINGESYHDIDRDWAECILWLSNTIGTFIVGLEWTPLHRSEYPDKLGDVII